MLVLWPYFISAFIIALFSYTLVAYIIPPANKIRLEFTYTYIKNPIRNTDKNIHKQIEPGLFVYMRSYNTMNDIGYKFTIEKFEEGKLVSKLISDYGQWDTAINAWKLRNYYSRTFIGTDEIIDHGNLIDTVLNLHPDDTTQII